MLPLCERHKMGKCKLPLGIPMVFYHSSGPFQAPKNLWSLFNDPALAKKVIGGDYQLIDVPSMSDHLIKQKKYVREGEPIERIMRLTGLPRSQIEQFM